MTTRMPDGADPTLWRFWVTAGEGFCPRGHGKLRTDRPGGCDACKGTWTVSPDPMAEYDAVEWNIYPELLDTPTRRYA